MADIELTNCPGCGNAVARQSRICPTCGNNVKAAKDRESNIGFLIMVAIGVVIYLIYF